MVRVSTNSSVNICNNIIEQVLPHVQQKPNNCSKPVMDSVKNIFKNIYTSYFLEEIQSNKKLDIYKEVKHNYHYEKYLTNVTKYELRSAITKFRLFPPPEIKWSTP